MAREPHGVREYATDEIVVEWQPGLCYHSDNCVRALPQGFDPEARPRGNLQPPAAGAWAKRESASAAGGAAAVAVCAAGAVGPRRGGPAARRPEPVDVRASA